MKTQTTVIASNEAIAELCMSRNGRITLNNVPMLPVFVFCLFLSVSAFAQNRDTSHKLINSDTTLKSKPLLVVDGIIYKGDLNSIDPNDISSVTVLKNPGASNIYGPPGANGAVLIQTKHDRIPTHTPNPLDSVVSKDALYVIDGIPSKNKMDDVDPKDILSIDILKKGKKTDSSFEPVNDVVAVVTKQGAIKSYQKRFSSYSKDYEKYIDNHKGDDRACFYFIDGQRVRREQNDLIQELYKIPAGKIIAIEVQYPGPNDSSVGVNVRITTKQ